MYSLKSINNTLKAFAQSHGQVNSYGYGDTFNMTAPILLYNQTENTKGIAYPIIWVMPTQSALERRLFKVNYKIVCADILLDDYSNVDFILSDTAQILGDLMANLSQNINKTPENFSIEEAYSFNLTPFMDDTAGMFPDKVAGWNLELTLHIINTNNACTIPFK